jgi:hypothetical protein
MIGCARCKAEFKPGKTGPKTTLCKSCRKKQSFAHQRAAWPEKPCPECGIVFRPNHHNRQRFCTKSCGISFRRNPNNPRVQQSKYCIICRTKLPTSDKKILCGNKECFKVHAAQTLHIRYVEKVQRHRLLSCKICHQDFRPLFNSKRRTICYSDICRRAKAYEALKVSPYALLRRANRVRANRTELFTHRQIFERDDWRCHLCGGKCITGGDGRVAPLYPTLDHITPLAQGGTHTSDNVQTAHRKCNSSKGSKVLGQLRLALPTPGMGEAISPVLAPYARAGGLHASQGFDRGAR